MSVPTRLKFPANTHRFYLTKSVLVTYPSFSQSFLMEIVRNFTVLSVRSGQTQRYQENLNRLRVATFRANLVYLPLKMYCWMGLLVHAPIRIACDWDSWATWVELKWISFQLIFKSDFNCEFNSNVNSIQMWFKSKSRVDSKLNFIFFLHYYFDMKMNSKLKQITNEFELKLKQNLERNEMKPKLTWKNKMKLKYNRNKNKN